MIRKNEYSCTSNLKVNMPLTGWSNNTYAKFSTPYKMLVYELHISSSFGKDMGCWCKLVPIYTTGTAMFQ
jgi:hypothetical protein